MLLRRIVLLGALFLSATLAVAQDVPGPRTIRFSRAIPSRTSSSTRRTSTRSSSRSGRRAASPSAKPSRATLRSSRTSTTRSTTSPARLQVIRNYQGAIKSIGGEVVYERLPKEGDGGETTLKVTTGGKEVWVRVEVGIFSAPTQSYKLWIVEVAAMQQVVSANKLWTSSTRTASSRSTSTSIPASGSSRPTEGDGGGDREDAEGRADAQHRNRRPHRQRRRGPGEQDTLREARAKRDGGRGWGGHRCQAPPRPSASARNARSPTTAARRGAKRPARRARQEIGGHHGTGSFLCQLGCKRISRRRRSFTESWVFIQADGCGRPVDRGRSIPRADVHVMISAGFYGVYSELAPTLEARERPPPDHDARPIDG